MSARFGHGLVIGKFYPPHRGHDELMRAAAERCDRVSVVLTAASTEVISVADRVRWLGWEIADRPNVTVIGVMDDHPIDYHDPAVWDLHEAVFRDALAEIAPGVPVDAVFTGEAYGDELARRFGAEHEHHARPADGPSGTRLRSDIFGHWGDLIPAARCGLACRIAIVGAESTGTTTLARALADALGASFVGEYGRIVSAAKLAGARDRAHRSGAAVPWLDGVRWTDADFTVIASRQAAAIDAACLSTPVAVADTDPLATSVWHERYLGGPHHPSLELARAQPPDLYILTSPKDVAFHQDGLRDGEQMRIAMHHDFERQLAAFDTPWTTVTGSPHQRLQAALDACAPALDARAALDPR